MISVSPTWSNAKLHGIQMNHRDRHKTPDSEYYLPSTKQMFVSKAAISSNWPTLCCINPKASLCSTMNDKRWEESSVDWQPPLWHANHTETPSVDGDKLICMIGKLVDKHTLGVIVQIRFDRFISVLRNRLLVNLFIQPTFIEQLFQHRHSLPF